MKYDVVHSENIFQGRVINIYRESIRYPDGHEFKIEFVSHGGSVAILPVDKDGNIWFVQQYRHPAGGLLLELPAGTLEENESPEVCAAREIQEEIGMAAAHLKNIGEFFLAPGYSSEYMFIFLATDLREDPLEQDAAEYIMVEKYSVEKAYEMVVRGEIKDAKTLGALTLARPLICRD